MKEKLLILLGAVILVGGVVVFGMSMVGVGDDVGTVPDDEASEIVVEGYVHMGPVCPVVEQGREEECQDAPYSVNIEIHYPDERLYKIIKSDEQGRFRVGLPLGEYVLRPQAANVLPVCEEERVVARKGETTNVDISCDSGIRAPLPPVACTMDAKLCPDGSGVGRTGPNCEFAPCPGE